jgi:hypothetical protein
MFANDLFGSTNEDQQRLDPKCWTGYKKQGTKMKGGVRVNNCVPANEESADAGITKDKETEFHAKLDRLVHDTFGKRDDEMTAKEGRDWDEGNREPANNFAITINGREWKVFQGHGYYADDEREMKQYYKLKDWCRKKSEQTGKQWEVFRTGAPATESVAEGGPFSYGKPSRKGSVSDLAAKKRKEQERGKQPIEPKDQMVGVAKIKKDIAEGRGNIEALRTELMGEYLNIYYNALDGHNMTDHIINLQDVYGRVKRSRDPVLQQTYNLLMDHAEESIDVQASAALKAIRILGDEPNYTPPPRPPMSPEDSARADAFVNQFLSALVSNGIKTHPDWQKNNAKGVAEEKKGLYYYVNKRKKAGISRDKDHPKAPTAQAWKDAARTAKNESVNKSYDLEVRLMEMRLAGYQV